MFIGKIGEDRMDEMSHWQCAIFRLNFMFSSNNYTNFLKISKGVQKLQKLHGVGKFFNGWRPDPPPPPPPPKKEILVPKRKYQTEKGSLTKNIGNFYECSKRLYFKGSYGWSTCQLKIIIGMYIKVNAVFLVSGQAE